MSRPPEPHEEPLPPSQQGGTDGMFANQSIVLLILFGFCCGPIALILGIVGVGTCKDPQAKKNAWILTTVGAASCAITTIRVYLAAK